MANILVSFKDVDSDRVPKPKATWIRDIVLRELEKMAADKPADLVDYAFIIRGDFVVYAGTSKGDALARNGISMADATNPQIVMRHGTAVEAMAQGWFEYAMNEYCFRVDGKVLHGMGSSPKEAASKLGLTGLLDWKTAAEAADAGWMKIGVGKAASQDGGQKPTTESDFFGG